MITTEIVDAIIAYVVEALKRRGSPPPSVDYLYDTVTSISSGGDVILANNGEARVLNNGRVNVGDSVCVIRTAQHKYVYYPPKLYDHPAPVTEEAGPPRYKVVLLIATGTPSHFAPLLEFIAEIKEIIIREPNTPPITLELAAAIRDVSAPEFGSPHNFLTTQLQERFVTNDFLLPIDPTVTLIYWYDPVETLNIYYECVGEVPYWSVYGMGTWLRDIWWWMVDFRSYLVHWSWLAPSYKATCPVPDEPDAGDFYWHYNLGLPVPPPAATYVDVMQTTVLDPLIPAIQAMIEKLGAIYDLPTGWINWQAEEELIHIWKVKEYDQERATLDTAAAWSFVYGLLASNTFGTARDTAVSIMRTKLLEAALLFPSGPWFQSLYRLVKVKSYVVYDDEGLLGGPQVWENLTFTIPPYIGPVPDTASPERITIQLPSYYAKGHVNTVRIIFDPLYPFLEPVVDDREGAYIFEGLPSGENSITFKTSYVLALYPAPRLTGRVPARLCKVSDPSEGAPEEINYDVYVPKVIDYDAVVGGIIEIITSDPLNYGALNQLWAEEFFGKLNVDPNSDIWFTHSTIINSSGRVVANGGFSVRDWWARWYVFWDAEPVISLLVGYAPPDIARVGLGYPEITDIDTAFAALTRNTVAEYVRDNTQIEVGDGVRLLRGNIEHDMTPYPHSYRNGVMAPGRLFSLSSTPLNSKAMSALTYAYSHIGSKPDPDRPEPPIHLIEDAEVVDYMEPTKLERWWSTPATSDMTPHSDYPADGAPSLWWVFLRDLIQAAKQLYSIKEADE